MGFIYVSTRNTVIGGKIFVRVLQVSAFSPFDAPGISRYTHPEGEPCIYYGIILWYYIVLLLLCFDFCRCRSNPQFWGVGVGSERQEGSAGGKIITHGHFAGFLSGQDTATV